MKTERGFELTHFNDDYEVDCTIQESSALEPHIWLGVNKPEVSIMYKDLVSGNFMISGSDMSCYVYLNVDSSGSNGWCKYPIPEQALVASRMHLTQEQARGLAEILNYFAEYGKLPDLDENVSLNTFTLTKE